MLYFEIIDSVQSQLNLATTAIEQQTILNTALSGGSIKLKRGATVMAIGAIGPQLLSVDSSGFVYASHDQITVVNSGSFVISGATDTVEYASSLGVVIVKNIRLIGPLETAPTDRPWLQAVSDKLTIGSHWKASDFLLANKFYWTLSFPSVPVVITGEKYITSQAVYGAGLTRFGFDVKQGQALPAKRLRVMQSGALLQAQSDPVGYWPDGSVCRYAVTVNSAGGSDLQMLLSDTENNASTSLTSSTIFSNNWVPNLVIKRYEIGLESVGADSNLLETLTCAFVSADFDSATVKTVGKMRSYWTVIKPIQTQAGANHPHLKAVLYFEAFADHCEYYVKIEQTTKVASGQTVPSVILQTDVRVGSTVISSGHKQLICLGYSPVTSYDLIVYPSSVTPVRLAKSNAEYRTRCRTLPLIDLTVPPNAARKSSIASEIDTFFATPNKTLYIASREWNAGMYVAQTRIGGEQQERALIPNFDAVGLSADDESLNLALLKNSLVEGIFNHHRRDTSGLPIIDPVYFNNSENYNNDDVPSGDRAGVIPYDVSNVSGIQVGDCRVDYSAFPYVLKQWNGSGFNIIPDTKHRLYARLSRLEASGAHLPAFGYAAASLSGLHIFAEMSGMSGAYCMMGRSSLKGPNGGLRAPIIEGGGELRQAAWTLRTFALAAMTEANPVRAAQLWNVLADTPNAEPNLTFSPDYFGTAAANPLRYSQLATENDFSAPNAANRAVGIFQHSYLAQSLRWLAEIWPSKFESLCLAGIEMHRIMLSDLVKWSEMGQYSLRVKDASGAYITSLAAFVGGPTNYTAPSGMKGTFDASMSANGHFGYLLGACDAIVDRGLVGSAAVAAKRDLLIADIETPWAPNSQAGTRTRKDYPSWFSRAKTKADLAHTISCLPSAVVTSNANIVVTIIDLTGAPVPNLSVTPISFSPSVILASASGVTNAAGQITLALNRVGAGAAKVSLRAGAAIAQIIEVAA